MRRRYDAQRLRAGILGGQARAVPAARIERPWSDLRQGQVRSGQAPGFGRASLSRPAGVNDRDGYGAAGKEGRAPAFLPTCSPYFGRIASAVPWMKALMLSMSSLESLPVKSGMPRAVAGPWTTNLSRFSI